ncbi:hypothetical protein GOARA_063_00620 [Gordonia araii NBRC 100433]|uniref:DUF6752 domain-containing protein n=1 Tax=Gordonia araii NBRC 100433 TaxID=1073574 RepID=G7H4T8_9ACTN|nr:DUF6752 domain-containing protein [Gordonia araii]NNG97997.1 hypothetical protein [Gordonia araii NBRC 100433]GAB10863.1 hypothetical protein GOARA_063_00620 [Gordonia araii NBRC 100433]
MQIGRDMGALKSRTGLLNEQFARAVGSVTKLRQLPSRFRELEREVQETQRLHQRVAELTDVVAEVLVPAADRDDKRIREVLAKYNETSF